MSSHNISENVLELHPSSELIKQDEVSLITKPFTRRGFLKTSAILAAGSVVTLDTLVFPQEAEAIVWVPMVVQTAKLLSKALLTAAAGYVAERGIEEIWRRIQEARLKESPRSSFHQEFANPVQFDFVEPPLKTRYRYYYGIQNHSETAPISPIPVGSDLNVFEIWAVLHPENPANRTPDGAFFIPYPHDERKPIEPKHHDVFYHSSVIRDRYGEDPEQFDLEYVRHFSNGADLLTGYGVRSPRLRYEKAFLLTGGRA